MRRGNHGPGNRGSTGSIYANHFKIGHNAFEFLIDFGQYLPDDERAELSARIVTTPAYAKALLEVLQEAIEQYEKRFGSIAAHG